MTRKSTTGYVHGINGVIYVPVEIEATKKEKDKPKDVYTYIPRNDGDPHPPILTGEDRDQLIISPMSFQPPVPGSACFLPVAATPVVQSTHIHPQYQYAHSAYQHPYVYNAAGLPPGTQVYYPQQALTTPSVPHYIIQESGSSKKKDKKDKKSKKSKSKKKRKDSTRTTQHVYYGRTPNEIYEDEIKMAGKEGVYGSTDIAPADPKPGDMFWVIPYEPGERAKLISYYEIMENHKPGRWDRGADGFLRWVKEEPKEESESESESSASEWEN